MSKKKTKSDEDELQEDFINEIEEVEETEEEFIEEDNSEKNLQLSDDDESLDIVIEIDEDDLSLDTDIEPKTEAQAEAETEGEIVLSKHKIQGKHSLKYDSIFKGKKEDPLDEMDGDATSMYFNENFEVDKSSNYHYESMDNESYVREKNLKEKVYNVLSNHTDINFLNNRRKPSKTDFNQYYFLLKTHLNSESFTNVELFNELSVYFSDNLFNMFKLLDNKWKNLIINELQEHIGKNPGSKEVKNRNIYIGTEIEFLDEEGLHITGVVVETFYDEDLFKVDSMEKIYHVVLEDITKIMNNNKFKYNLNKLNNIDFL